MKTLDVLDEKYRQIFEFKSFNKMQSELFHEIHNSDNSLVVVSPTASGKTVLFDLAIIRLIKKIENDEISKNSRILYVAPMKALCHEKSVDWAKKYTNFNLRTIEFTGDHEEQGEEIFNKSQIILTTPEKWEYFTRGWKNNINLMKSIHLVCIDEIHILSDPSRGGVIETAISRMKAILNHFMKENESSNFERRILAISATLQNISDISNWLGLKGKRTNYYKFDDEYKSVKVDRIVLGFPKKDTLSDFGFDLSLNFKLKAIIQQYSEGKPTLIFCSTRKGTQLTASTLVKDYAFPMARRENENIRFKDSKLTEFVHRGVAYHNAGMDVIDRQIVESLFLNHKLSVLCCTSTLSTGVNLPAHLVIIKSTFQYINGKIEEYNSTQINQMIGRAGRPQFDTSATAIIMTSSDLKDRYENLLDGSIVTESSLYSNLADKIFCEITNKTIIDIQSCFNWIKSTFMYIRMKKNPTFYKLKKSANPNDIDKEIHEKIISILNSLKSWGLIDLSDNGDIKATKIGNMMINANISFETYKILIKIEGKEDMKAMFNIVMKTKEFTDIILRRGEKKLLNTLSKHENIRFKFKGKVKTVEDKINILLQSTLGCVVFHDFSLLQDVTRIIKSCERVAKFMIDYCSYNRYHTTTKISVILFKSFKSKLWDTTPYVSKQIEKIGSSLSQLLVQAGLISFEKISERHPREIELILKRNPPFGNQIIDSINTLPRYIISIATSDVSKVRVEMPNYLTRKSFLDKRTTNLWMHSCYVIIGDDLNNLIQISKIPDIKFFETGFWERTFNFNKESKFIYAYVTSAFLVGISQEDRCQVNKEKLTVKKAKKTDLKYHSFDGELNPPSQAISLKHFYTFNENLVKGDKVKVVLIDSPKIEEFVKLRENSELKELHLSQNLDNHFGDDFLEELITDDSFLFELGKSECNSLSHLHNAPNCEMILPTNEKNKQNGIITQVKHNPRPWMSMEECDEEIIDENVYRIF